MTGPMTTPQSIGDTNSFKRVPRHVALIPDGNRRWAKERGLSVADGYKAGVQSGLQMLGDCMELGIDEVTVYGFTQDNTKRPRDQCVAFSEACVEFANTAQGHDIGLLVVGDTSSRMFPKELKRFAEQRHGRMGPQSRSPAGKAMVFKSHCFAQDIQD
jgi:undecaprenyl diphosphate synthase